MCPEALRRLRTSLEETEGVERVIHMKTLHLGPEELLVAVKIAVARSESLLVWVEIRYEAPARRLASAESDFLARMRST